MKTLLKFVLVAVLCDQIAGCAKDQACKGFDEKRYAKEVMAKEYPELATHQVYRDVSCSYTDTVYSPAILGWFAPEERGCAIALVPTVLDVSHGFMADLYEFVVNYNTSECANSYKPSTMLLDTSRRDFDAVMLQDAKSEASRPFVPM